MFTTRSRVPRVSSGVLGNGVPALGHRPRTPDSARCGDRGRGDRLAAPGSFGPLADAWIFVGSLLATLGMARGYVEFWLIWIAADVVGVTLLLRAGYYPSALLYIV